MAMSPLLRALIGIGVASLRAGLHHLPAAPRIAGAVGPAFDALSALDAAIEAEGFLHEVDLKAHDAEKAWAALDFLGFDPFRVHALAAAAGSRPGGGLGNPLVRTDGVVQLPTRATIPLEEQQRERSAHQAYLQIMQFALRRLDDAIYRANSKNIKQQYAITVAKNTICDAEMLFTSEFLPEQETQLLVRIGKTLGLLASAGIDTVELELLSAEISKSPNPNKPVLRRE